MIGFRDPVHTTQSLRVHYRNPVIKPISISWFMSCQGWNKVAQVLSLKFFKGYKSSIIWSNKILCDLCDGKTNGNSWWGIYPVVKTRWLASHPQVRLFGFWGHEKPHGIYAIKFPDIPAINFINCFARVRPSRECWLKDPPLRMLLKLDTVGGIRGYQVATLKWLVARKFKIPQSHTGWYGWVSIVQTLNRVFFSPLTTSWLQTTTCEF